MANFKMYGAAGTNGICIYNNFGYCQSNGRKYLGGKFHYKGFQSLEDAAYWACTQFNDLTGANLATPDQIKDFNTIVFAKDMRKRAVAKGGICRPVQVVRFEDGYYGG